MYYVRLTTHQTERKEKHSANLKLGITTKTIHKNGGTIC